MITAIQRLLDRETPLALPAADITERADLYELGLTPFAAVQLLLAIEREFSIEWPLDMLRRETARSIASIVEALQALPRVPAPAAAWLQAA